LEIRVWPQLVNDTLKRTADGWVASNFACMMSRSTLWIVITLMSVSLLGIIFLQLYWIRHDFSLKEQQFERQVQDALNQTVQKADIRQVLNFISREYLGFESDSGFWKAMDSTLRQSSLPHGLLAEELTSGTSAPGHLHTSTRILLHDSVIAPGQTHQENLLIRSDSLGKTTEIDHVRVSEKQISADKTSVRNPWLQAEVEKQRIRLEKELTRMKVKFTSRVERINEVMTGLALSYAMSVDDPMRHLSVNELDTLLSRELRYRGINIPYTFGILNTKKDSLIPPRDSLIEAALRSTPYSIELFPNEFFSRGLMLLVYFPSRTAFVLGNMWKMLLASAGFTLAIILIFIYTVNLLLKQKKLADIKSDFINNMTHEFKTPIATIALAIDAINNPKIAADPDKVRYYSHIIREENRRMNRQVETILQTALFEKNEFRIKRQPVNLHELIQKAVENIQVQVTSRNGTIRTQLHALNPTIEGDELLLTTAIVNLLDNANKYSPAAPEITVTTEDREQGVVLSIADKGMGMDKETLNRIFEKFYRKNSGNIHNIKGFGLGLSHVKSIVEAHGGSIKVSSEPGLGSCFSLFLPHNAHVPVVL
jgi:two-component system phosphate regulon sensor histidine kinase PhoR